MKEELFLTALHCHYYTSIFTAQDATKMLYLHKGNQLNKSSSLVVGFYISIQDNCQKSPPKSSHSIWKCFPWHTSSFACTKPAFSFLKIQHSFLSLTKAYTCLFFMLWRHLPNSTRDQPKTEEWQNQVNITEVLCSLLKHKHRIGNTPGRLAGIH